MVKNVYLIFAELSDETPSSAGNVTAVVPADDIRTAIDFGENALRDDGLDVWAIENAIRFKPEDWRHDKTLSKAAAASAQDDEVRLLLRKDAAA